MIHARWTGISGGSRGSMEGKNKIKDSKILFCSYKNTREPCSFKLTGPSKAETMHSQALVTFSLANVASAAWNMLGCHCFCSPMASAVEIQEELETVLLHWVKVLQLLLLPPPEPPWQSLKGQYWERMQNPTSSSLNTTQEKPLDLHQTEETQSLTEESSYTEEIQGIYCSPMQTRTYYLCDQTPHS